MRVPCIEGLATLTRPGALKKTVTRAPEICNDRGGGAKVRVSPCAPYPASPLLSKGSLHEGQPQRKTLDPPISLALAAVILALIAGGAGSTIRRKMTIGQRTLNELSAIARLKADQIAAWRRERLADASLISEMEYLSGDAASWRAGRKMAARNASLRIPHHGAPLWQFRCAADVGRRPCGLSLSGRAGVHRGYMDSLAQAFRTRLPVFNDLHTDRYGRPAPELLSAPFHEEGGE